MSRDPLSEGRPLLAFSVTSWGPTRVSSHVLWAVGGRLSWQWYRGPAPVRASVLLSRVLVGAGVTPAVHLRGPAPLATPPSQSVSARRARILLTWCNGGCGTCVVGSSRLLGRPCSDDPVSKGSWIRGPGPWPRGSVPGHHWDKPLWRPYRRTSQAGGEHLSTPCEPFY